MGTPLSYKANFKSTFKFNTNSPWSSSLVLCSLSYFQLHFFAVAVARESDRTIGGNSGSPILMGDVVLGVLSIGGVDGKKGCMVSRLDDDRELLKTSSCGSGIIPMYSEIHSKLIH